MTKTVESSQKVQRPMCRLSPDVIMVSYPDCLLRIPFPGLVQEVDKFCSTLCKATIPSSPFDLPMVVQLYSEQFFFPSNEHLTGKITANEAKTGY
uniref:Uncharacterized protein n=1 Tax=Arundo donax TaxID=35708 RepID=A0A0A8XV09_ARUDO